MGEKTEALMEFNKCLARLPNNSSLHLARGLCHQSRGEDYLYFAEADYKMVLEIDPGNPIAHNQLGLVYQRRGNHQTAISEFQAAIKIRPDLFVVYNNLGASLIALARYEEAISLIQKAIALNPDTRGIHLYHNLGNGKVRRTQYQKNHRKQQTCGTH